jgi:hypothetical protein
MIANLIGELICSGLCHALFAGVAGDSAVKNAQKPSTELRTSAPTGKITSAPTGNRSKRLIENRDALRNCSLDGCSALTFRSSDYCLRHQDQKPLEQEADANWWEEQTE